MKRTLGRAQRAIRKKMASKPAAPKGTMAMIDGKAMIEDRLPRKKK